MNTTIKSQSLSSDAALALWNEVRDEVIKAIVGTIRTMGLPVTPREGGVSVQVQGTGRTPSPQAVRMALLRDRDLHDDILDDVVAQFWKAVHKGTVVGPESKGLVFCIVQRATWKRATRRARELLCTLEPMSAEGVLASVPSEGRPVDDEIDRKRTLKRLQQAFERLSPDEQTLLLTRVEGTYGAVCLPELKQGSIRSRASRLWKDIREEVLEGTRTA